MILLDYLDYHAQRRPDKKALVYPYEQKEYTFRELNKVVKKVSSGFRETIGTQNGVAVHLPRSTREVIAIYSIISSGNWYTPIPVTTPVSSTVKRITRSDVEYIVTDKKQYKKMIKNDNFNCKKAFIFDSEKGGDFKNNFTTTDSKILSRHDVIKAGDTCRNNNTGCTFDRRAAVLHKTNSNGNLIGIDMPIRSLHVFANWVQEELGLGQDSYILHQAPIGLDLTIPEIFAPIISGGTVHVTRTKAFSFPGHAVNIFETYPISHLLMSPSTYIHLLKNTSFGELNMPQLEAILFAGEVFPGSALKKLAQSFTSVDYYNLYGLTEANTCLYYKTSAQELMQNTSVPLGKPVPGHTATILNENGTIINVEGVTGELAITGPSVVDGYTNSQLPVDEINGVEALNTGDTVYRNKNGNYIFDNREGSAVKVRGHSVVPNKIETILEKHDRVQTALIVTIKKTDSVKGTKIIGFVEGGNITDDQLARYCTEQLPTIEIPDEIYCFDEFPRTKFGRVDVEELKKQHKLH